MKKKNSTEKKSVVIIFLDIMEKDYPYVKLTRRMKHAQCKECGELVERMRLAQNDAEREQITQERKKHWTKVNTRLSHLF